jgi:putative flavoprotein involved in K+ transport
VVCPLRAWRTEPPGHEPTAATTPGAATSGAALGAEVVVIGAGQAGLAAGFYLRRAGLRAGLDFVLLDDSERPGGAWLRMWPSLRLFSPPEYSSLPGWLMPSWPGDGFPLARHAIEYLAQYEQRYQLPVRRPVRVTSVRRADDDPDGHLVVSTSAETWRARAVISATGTWTQPFVPHYPGTADYTGRQLHTTGYRSAEDFTGRRVAVVGGGNSAAQILAEVSRTAETVWVTQRPPRFLPDDVDGRVLFQVATARRNALDAGDTDTGGVSSLGDIVMVPAVKEARARGVLVSRPPFHRLSPTGLVWPDGSEERVDAMLWCTGFRPALRHLSTLALRREGGHVATDGTQAVGEPRLHMLGYGDWTGPASATLIGVGRTARDAVAAILPRLRS